MELIVCNLLVPELELKLSAIFLGHGAKLDGDLRSDRGVHGGPTTTQMPAEVYKVTLLFGMLRLRCANPNAEQHRYVVDTPNDYTASWELKKFCQRHVPKTTNDCRTVCQFARVTIFLSVGSKTHLPKEQASRVPPSKSRRRCLESPLARFRVWFINSSKNFVKPPRRFDFPLVKSVSSI